MDQGLQRLIKLRKEHEAFAGGELEIVPTENEHLLGYVRVHADHRTIVFANFSENLQTVPTRLIRQFFVPTENLLHEATVVTARRDLSIEPLDFVVFGK